MENIVVRTKSRVELIDITAQIQDIVTLNHLDEGICQVFVPHTTAGITINENADPDVCSDIINCLNKMVPFNDMYKHAEGNSAAHIKASMLGFSLSVIVEGGRLQLGTWQGIYFAEFDGPRNRKVWVKL
ncbi:MAG: secondary thiamine-phosphate synthase enzyme YjbQ [Candidatus Omnitrophica bacterium]|nr:secondary thiamine-phosphate synthase enzyme YjbQ [Candidatus Omnitrophota bacterium]